MLESFKGNTLEYQKLTEEEMQQRGILGRLVGVIADSKNPTRNGRLYGRTLWENVFNDPIVQEKINNRCFFGELDHPTDRDETCTEKIAGCLAEQPKFNDQGQLVGVFDILNTPNGRILKSLCDYGTTIGVSSRGNGDVFTNDDGVEEVDESTYTCEGWDFVLVPAVESARVQRVNESLQDTQKSLRKALRESLAQASEDDKKVMKETLKHLGIKLTEPKKKLNEDVNTQESEDIKSSIKETTISEKAVTDNEADGLLKQLQETLKSKVKLEKQLQELQERLAVSDAKVKKLDEDCSKYKQSTIGLSKQVLSSKDLKKENEQLKEQLETKDKFVKALSSKITTLNETISKSNSSSKSLNESLSSKDREVTKLRESLMSEKKSHKEEVASLNNKLADIKKNYEVKLQESNSKFTKATKLIEKYKNYVEATVDRYIESKALVLGITPNEIKNRLNESYTLSDVDRICDDLQDYNLRISKLPFNVSKGTKVSITENKKPQVSNPDNEDDLSGLVNLMNRI